MKKTPKQIAAILCIVLLVLLFAACLMATVGLPILLWIYIWLYGKYRERRSGAGLSGTKDDAKND